MMGYLEKLTFSKDWTNADDFPTYEPDESQVRADLQLLHDEAKAAINALVEKLESSEFASHLAVSTEGMAATNLAAALAEILATAKAAQAGTIVDYVWNKYAYEQKVGSGGPTALLGDVAHGGTAPTNGNFQYTVASAVAMNPTTGEITLVNPTAVSRQPVAGEYFKCSYWYYTSYQDDPNIYRWTDHVTSDHSQVANYVWAYSWVGCERIFSALVFQGIATSASADAYPADGWVGSVKYVSAPKSQLSSVG